MKWTYFPRKPGYAALWQLNEDKDVPSHGFGAKLYAIDFRDCSWGDKSGWQVTVAPHKCLGTLPYDTPEEELKALAIAMWRLG